MICYRSHILVSFINENNILYDGQYGFRKNHLTSSAITEFIDKIYNNLDDSKLTLSVFIDLKKAFDTIDHQIPLSKLESYGVRGIALDWIGNYLNHTYQYVLFNEISYT